MKADYTTNRNDTIQIYDAVCTMFDITPDKNKAVFCTVYNPINPNDCVIVIELKPGQFLLARAALNHNRYEILINSLKPIYHITCNNNPLTWIMQNIFTNERQPIVIKWSKLKC